MQALSFKVDLRLESASFETAGWQMAADRPAAYRQYLDFYSLPTTAESRFGWLQLQQYRIWTQAFRPQARLEQGTLLHLHGYYDHGASYPSLQQLALERGYAYLTVDLPGHGLSSGERASILSFDVYSQLLGLLLEQLEQQNFPRPWLLSGFSTGGAIALEHLLDGSRFERMALIAPLIRPVGWKAIRRWLWLVRLFVRQLPRKFRANSNDEAYLAFAHDKDPLQPMQLPLRWVSALARWVPRIERAAPVAAAPLILQGDEDTTVDWQYNLSVLHRLVPRARIELVEQGAHQLLNEAERQRSQVLDWLGLWLDGELTESEKKG